MRKVSRYQATADTAPRSRAVLWDASGVDRSVSIKYPARRRVVTMATSRPIRDAFLVTSLVHTAHRSPGATPAVCWPQPAHGLLEPAGHSPGEFSGRSATPQILGADVVLHDRRFERPAQPARRLDFADMAEHPRGAGRLGRGICDC